MPHHHNLYVKYETEIPSEDIPDSVDVPSVLDRYAKHACHMGSWPVEKPEPTSIPKSGEFSHVVRNVELNENGGLNVSFEFVSSLRGFELVKQFDNSPFKMVPVLSEDKTMILRFDFQKEENDGHSNNSTS